MAPSGVVTTASEDDNAQEHCLPANCCLWLLQPFDVALFLSRRTSTEIPRHAGVSEAEQQAFPQSSLETEHNALRLPVSVVAAPEELPDSASAPGGHVYDEVQRSPLSALHRAHLAAEKVLARTKQTSAREEEQA